MEALSARLNPLGSVWEGDGRFIIAVVKIEPDPFGWYEDDLVTGLILNSDGWPERVGSLYRLPCEGLRRNYARIA